MEAVSLILKEPKELKTHRSRVSLELFWSGDFMCPVSAYQKYLLCVRKKGRNLNATDPLFMFNGKGYTRSSFNADIRSLLADVVDYSKGKLLSHSFRSGMATAMARAGFSQEEIMLVGRWTSDSYLAYIKQGRSARFETMRNIASKMSELSRTWSPGNLIV